VAGKRGAGEGTVWKRNGRWYAKRRVGSREDAVSFNASGSTRAEALANSRAKAEQHERDSPVAIDASVTLADTCSGGSMKNSPSA
jgi:hypothetical protein